MQRRCGSGVGRRRCAPEEVRRDRPAQRAPVQDVLVVAETGKTDGDVNVPRPDAGLAPHCCPVGDQLAIFETSSWNRLHF